MPRVLKPTKFGNPILRKKARRLTVAQIRSDKIQTLIRDMSHTLEKEDFGVGIAAPQIGQSIALSVVGIKPTPTRPNLKRFSTVLINPEIVETYGDPIPKWEGCISCGEGDHTLYAKVPRYKRVKLRWLDDTGEQHQKILTSFVAHVAQHETDHLNGVLFVDRVVDTSTYMMADEYKKRIVKKRK